MKKILIGLFLMLGISNADYIAQTYYGVPTANPLSPYTDASVIINGKQGFVSANKVFACSITVNGIVSASYFVGNGSLLTNLPSSGGGITTENADLRYVSNNYNAGVSVNGKVSANSFVGGTASFASVQTAGNEAIKMDIMSGTSSWTGLTPLTITLAHGKSTNIRGVSWAFPNCDSTMTSFVQTLMDSTNVKCTSTYTNNQTSKVWYCIIFYI